MKSSTVFGWLVAIGFGGLLAYFMHGPINSEIAGVLGPTLDADTASSAPVIRADLLLVLTLLVQIAFAAGVAAILLYIAGRKRRKIPGSD